MRRMCFKAIFRTEKEARKSLLFKQPLLASFQSSPESDRYFWSSVEDIPNGQA